MTKSIFIQPYNFKTFVDILSCGYAMGYSLLLGILENPMECIRINDKKGETRKPGDIFFI